MVRGEGIALSLCSRQDRVTNDPRRMLLLNQQSSSSQTAGRDSYRCRRVCDARFVGGEMWMNVMSSIVFRGLIRAYLTKVSFWQ